MNEHPVYDPVTQLGKPSPTAQYRALVRMRATIRLMQHQLEQLLTQRTASCEVCLAEIAMNEK